MTTTAPIFATPRSVVSSASFQVGALAVLCALFSALRWGKLDRLWGDSDRWMFEVYRTANSEIPYLDFAWQYPPLAIYLGAAFLLVGGAKFATLQVFVDLLSTLIVFLSTDTARRFLPGRLPLAVGILTACVGASNTGNFALFSLQIYTPALLTGIIGLLLLIRAYADYLDSGVWDRSLVSWAAAGAFIALLSKPEFIVGTIGAVAAGFVAGRDRWYRGWTGYLREHGLLLPALFVPTAMVYGALGLVAGFANLLEGVGGYGIARLTCPWWPTGLGLFGGLASLCFGGLIAGVLSLLRYRAAWEKHGRTYLLMLAGAILSAGLLALYLPNAIRESPVLQGGTTPFRLVAFALSAGNLLLPVMWIGIVWAVWLAVASALRVGTALPRGSSRLALLLFPALLISLRGLFGGTMSQLTSVSAAAYPLLFIVAGHLLLVLFKWLDSEPADSMRRVSLVSAILLGYAAIRLAGAVSTEVRTPYSTLSTEAGLIRLQEAGISSDVYAYVLAHTKPGEPILDVANGGGVNFAAHRSSPIFSTQFTALAPATRYLEEDLSRLRQRPPSLVIANAGEDFQATYGLCLKTGCTCPSLVWSSTTLACEPTRKFPALEYVRSEYEPRMRFGEKIMYARKAGPSHGY